MIRSSRSVTTLTEIVPTCVDTSREVISEFGYDAAKRFQVRDLISPLLCDVNKPILREGNLFSPPNCEPELTIRMMAGRLVHRIFERT